MTVRTKYLRLAVCLLVLASYLLSFLLVHWLTHDTRRFLLPALECALLFTVLWARLFSLKLPREIRPRISIRLAEGRTPHAT